MATVTLTSYFASLDGWQGQLLEASAGTVVNTRTSTTFAYTYPADHQFPGYKVTITGSGFTYDGTTPTGGTMNKIVITDNLGNPVITISGLAADTMASDLALFASYSFGFEYPDGGGSGPQTKSAWSLILSGNDVINGTAGDDYRGLPGMSAGNDTYNMKGGNDWVLGGMGNDTVNGGDGFDTFSFEETHYNEGMSATRGINVNVATGTVIDAWGYTDKVTGIEQFIGSSYNDVFLGGASEDRFAGLRGIDTFKGGSGGNDWVVYDQDRWFGGLAGIVVDLSVTVSGGTINGTIRDGFGNTDKTVNIESVAGTVYGDLFIGSSAQNNFAGGEGKDNYIGDGGADWVFLHWRFSDQVQTGVVVDLTRASGQIQNDGYGNVEDAISIENIVGSSQNDKIKGSAGQNWIDGHDGKDTLTGAGGNDFFQFVDRNHFGDGDVITDFNAAAGANHDVLQIFVSNWGATDTLNLVNGTAATGAFSTFIFNAANDTLYWDPDGTGAQAKIAVAVLTNVASLSADDFDLV